MSGGKWAHRSPNGYNESSCPILCSIPDLSVATLTDHACTLIVSWLVVKNFFMISNSLSSEIDFTKIKKKLNNFTMLLFSYTLNPASPWGFWEYHGSQEESVRLQYRRY